jgi:hypothetical protein
MFQDIVETIGFGLAIGVGLGVLIVLSIAAYWILNLGGVV